MLSVYQFGEELIEGMAQGDRVESLAPVSAADLVLFCLDPASEARVEPGVRHASRIDAMQAIVAHAARASGEATGGKLRASLAVVIINADRWLDQTCGTGAEGPTSLRPGWVAAWYSGDKSPGVVAEVSTGVRDLLVREAPRLVAVAESAFGKVTYVPTAYGCAGQHCDDRARQARWCEVPFTLDGFMRPDGARGQRPWARVQAWPGPSDSTTVEHDAAGSGARQLRRLLDAHRVLAIARGPLDLRVSILRRLVDAAPASDLLRSDLIDHERVLQSRLIDELSALENAKDSTGHQRAQAIVTDLADARWQEPLTGAAVEHLQRVLAGIERSLHDAVFPRPEVATTRLGTRLRSWCPRLTSSTSRFVSIGTAITAASIALALIGWGRGTPAARGLKTRATVRSGVAREEADARGLAGTIEAMIDGRVIPAIEIFELAVDRGARPDPRLRPLRARAASELAVVEERLRGLAQTDRARESQGMEASDHGIERVVGALHSRFDDVTARFNRAVDRCRDADQRLIGARFDAAEAASGKDARDALAAAELFLDGVEEASGVRHDGLHDRARRIRATLDYDDELEVVSQRVDQAAAEGINAFLGALHRNRERLADVHGRGDEALAAVQAMADHYRSVLAWSEVARCWRPFAKCGAVEAKAWRTALEAARSIPACAVGLSDDQGVACVEEHLASVVGDAPRGAESFLEYLELPVMRAGVHQAVVDSRVFYCPDGSRRAVFVDEETVSSNVDSPTRLPVAGRVAPAPHVELATDLRELFRNALNGTNLVDHVVIRSLRMLGDGDRVDGVDPILLSRLEGDLLRLASRRPLFHGLAGDMLAIAERLRLRLGEQPRWVWSVNWTNDELWRNARRSAEEVMPSGRTLERLAEACERSMRELEIRPRMLCDARLIGWVGANRSGVVVRGATNVAPDLTGAVMVVRRDDADRWQLVRIGSLTRGGFVASSGDVLSFGEPLFLAADAATEPRLGSDHRPSRERASP